MASRRKVDPDYLPPQFELEAILPSQWEDRQRTRASSPVEREKALWEAVFDTMLNDALSQHSRTEGCWTCDAWAVIGITTMHPYFAWMCGIFNLDAEAAWSVLHRRKPGHWEHNPTRGRAPMVPRRKQWRAGFGKTKLVVV